MFQAHILIAAPNATTRFGGEAILPLHYYRILRARGYRVELITHARNREDLTSYFDGDTDGIHFVPDTRLHRRIWGIGKSLPSAIRSATIAPLMSLATDRDLVRALRQKIDPTVPTIVHVPTPVSPKTPSMVYGLGVPVVFGPMNGGMNYPPEYRNYMSSTERVTFGFARSMANLANRILPGKRKSAALLVSNKRTADALPSGGPEPIELVENGVDLSLWSGGRGKASQRGSSDPFRLIFLGRLVDWKAVDVTLKSLEVSRTRGVDIRFDIVGDGDQRAALSDLVEKRGLQEIVTFHGFLAQSACVDLVERADALILNSLFECGGAVVLEAMAQGLPVIASDWGGPADYLDDTCGRLVSPNPRASFADRLADAIVEMAGDPDLCQRMGGAGQDKVRQKFDWEKKVDRILDIYENTLNPVVSDSR